MLGRIRFLILIFLLSACASESKINWVRADLNSADFLVANGRCKAEAFKAIPQITQNNSCGGESKIVASENKLVIKEETGFSSGYCKGTALRQQRGLRSVRDEIFDGCMFENGWSKELLEEGK